jgi:HlyD family secretion protein
MSRSVVPRDAIAFQNDLDAVLAEPPPRLLRVTNAIVAGLLLTLIAIAAVVKTDVVVTGRGQLRADTPTILLQPVERAIIRNLKVRAGDHVSRGDVVALLDPTFTEADVKSLTERAAEVKARIERLNAELSPSPPPMLGTGDEQHVLQERVYLRRQYEFSQRLASFDQAIARDTVAMQANRNTAEALAHQLVIATDVAGMRSALMQSADGSKLQYLEAETSRIEAEKQFRSARDQMKELAHAIDAARADRQAFIAEWQRSAAEDLIAAKSEEVRVEDELTKATRLHDLIRLEAPCDGIVLDVAPRAAGSVLHEAEPLITILPAGAAMIADVSVPSAQIGQLVPGQNVVLKVDAFPYQQHGLVHGIVRSIAEESVPDPQSGAANHRVQITLVQQRRGALEDGETLFPGMTVTAEVNVGARNVLAYFLYPITRGFSESLREP